MAYEVMIDSSGEMDTAETFATAVGYSLPISRINQIVQAKLAELSDDDIYQTRVTISEATALVHEVLRQQELP